MANGGREMIPLEKDQNKNDPVINQHIMQMIDTDIFGMERSLGDLNGSPEDPKWRIDYENW